MNPAQQLPMLLDGVLKGMVGSPSIFLPLAAAAAQVPAGQGVTKTLINLSADLDLHDHQTGKQHAGKLGRAPLVLTASVFGVGSGSSGPLVGTAQWGSGNGAQQSVEFDIPLSGVNLSSAQASGGAQLTVPCTALSITARNDGNVIPVLGGQPIGDAFGIPFQVANVLPTAAASIGIGSKQSGSVLTRTIWIANGGGGLAATASVGVAVPAWAQCVRVLRFDASNTIQVTIVSLGLSTLAGPYNEAANAPPTVYVLPSTAGSITVKNTGGAAIAFMALVFELGL